MTHLHLHSEYSLLDSIIKIPDLVKELKLRGDKAVAITDHGTLGGWVELYKECKKHGLKPIFGVEFYHSLTENTNENYHITLLARNKIGFDNIIELNNLANENFYKKPRVTTKMMMEHGEGIVGLSGCIQGYLAQSVLHEDFDNRFWDKMVDSFDEFYLEVQDSGLREQKIIRNAFEKTGLPMVATIDSHYLHKNDSFAHEVSLGIMTNKKLSDPKRMKFDTNEFYVKTEDEMLSLFPAEWVKASDLIADGVERFDIGYDEWHLPTVEVDVKRELMQLEFALDDYEFTKKIDHKEYADRLHYEFKVISDNGFLPYFKMVAELCQHFDSNGWFRGWGRGSASGSLVSFLYGITKIDPIEWGLYFERFLNPDRISPPDIDLDFMPEHKSKAIEFFRDKYGGVYQIGNYGTLATKEVINSAKRIMEISSSLSEYVPNKAPVPTIAELLEDNDVFRKQAKLEQPEFIDVLLKLEGLKRNFSTHASGVVIDTGLPLRTSRSGVNKGLLMTVWDMYALEDMKYTKFDILGVNNLSVIDRVCRKIKIDVRDIPLDDSETFKLIQDCKTVGVFQWESDGFTKLIKDMHPDKFDELLDLNTLYRPGCLESGLTQQYIDRKFGREKVVQLHPKLNMRTQGLPLYQEDIMNMARVLAGFTLSEADILRKAIGKKEKKTFDKVHAMWIDGCSNNGIDPDEASKLWDMIEKFARYTWNKAHSVAYTLISWWTAYLSAHYPAEFMCELLNSADSSDRRRLIFSECRSRGIPIMHPDINRSEREFTTVDDAILVGLSGIKFVGDKTLDSIFKARKDGRFGGPDEVKDRTKANKKHIEYLIKAGAFGSKPSIEDEKESLGYNVGMRMVDKIWWSMYCSDIGEIIDIHNITTKKGDPMCFLKVEYFDRVDSITVFPRQYQIYKDVFNKGYLGMFKINHDKILQYSSGVEIDKLAVHIYKPEEFLSFSPSMDGRPNIYFDGMSISTIKIDNKMLQFIESEFGISKITLA